MENNYKVWQPMKYNTAKKPELLSAALEDGSNYGLQLKKDGASYCLAKDLDGTVHLYGSRISKKTGTVIDKIGNVPHLRKWVEKNFPVGTQIMVEICYGSTSKDVNSIMLCKPENAISRQENNGFVEAFVFDILYLNGEEVYLKDFQDRYKILSKSLSEWTDSTHISKAELFLNNKQEILSDWLAAGEEGGVLKLLTSTSKRSAAHAVSELGATAKRPAHVAYKVKQIDTVDVIFMGVIEPTAEYTGKDAANAKYFDKDGNPINRLYAQGLINAIEVGYYDKEIDSIKSIGTVSSGLTDEMREFFRDVPLNSVVEVECMEVDKKEFTLRHPRFKIIREDKNYTECTISTIF